MKEDKKNNILIFSIKCHLNNYTIITSHTHPLFSIVIRVVFFPPGEVRRQDLQSDSSAPCLQLQSLKRFAQARCYGRLCSLPRAPLQLVSLALVHTAGHLLQQPEVVDHVHVCELVERKIFNFVSDSITILLELVFPHTRQTAAPCFTLGTLVLGLLRAVPASQRVT